MNVELLIGLGFWKEGQTTFLAGLQVVGFSGLTSENNVPEQRVAYNYKSHNPRPRWSLCVTFVMARVRVMHYHPRQAAGAFINYELRKGRWKKVFF